MIRHVGYGHEVLMCLQTWAKFLGTHSTTSVTVSVVRYFNMTWYLVVQDFLFWTCSQWRSSEVAVKFCCVLLINHEAVGLLLVRLTMNCCLWIVAVFYWVIILLLKPPDTVQLRPKRRNTNRYGCWKSDMKLVAWQCCLLFSIKKLSFAKPNVTYIHLHESEKVFPE
jgi:hypothetical protein